MPVARHTLRTCVSFGSEGSNDLPARLNPDVILTVGTRWCGAPETVIARPFRCITPHEVSLTVTDSTGRTNTHTIDIWIGTIC
jgi:hypothetical protein